MLLRLFASLFVLIVFSLFFFRFFNHSKTAVSDPPGPQVRYFRQRRRDDVVPVGRQSSLFQSLLRLVVGVFVVLFCCHPPRNVRKRNKSNSSLLLIVFGWINYVSLSLSLQGCKSGFRTRVIILILFLILARATLRARIANQVGEDSCCRGGIVHIQCGCSCALAYGVDCPKALWRFRASTSNSLSSRTLAAHVHASFVIFIKFTLNKIFEYVEMTICKPPKTAVAQSQGALTSSRKYLSTLEMTVLRQHFHTQTH